MKTSICRPAGFSFVDLLGALMISAALVLLSVPRLAELREHAFIRLAAEKLQLELEHAYLLSKLEGSEIRVSFAADAITLSREGTALRSIPLAPGIKVSFSGNTARQVDFYHGQTATPAGITLSSSSQSCRLTISLRGRVKLQC